MNYPGSGILNQNSTRFHALTDSKGVGTPNDPTNKANNCVEFATLFNESKTISDLNCLVDYVPPTGQNVTITLYVNGVPTALTVTIDDTGKSANDIINSVVVNKNDLGALKITTSSGFNGYPQSNITWATNWN